MWEGRRSAFERLVAIDGADGRAGNAGKLRGGFTAHSVASPAIVERGKEDGSLGAEAWPEAMLSTTWFV
jgi:hypothetical protein